MSGLLRYPIGYVLDFYRERVTAEDFREAAVARVLLAGDIGGGGMLSLGQKLFPGAEFLHLESQGGWRAGRAVGAGAVMIAMTGGGVGWKLRALLCGARHVLLVPSPDYVYRLGMRAGLAGRLWAGVDRFLLAPLALLWLGALALALYTVGPARALAKAARE